MKKVIISKKLGELPLIDIKRNQMAVQIKDGTINEDNWETIQKLINSFFDNKLKTSKMGKKR